MSSTKPKPENITLKVGEATYEMSNSLNTWCELEKAFDCGINQIIKKFSDTDTLRTSEIRTYVVVALTKARDAKVTAEQAEMLCDVLGITECTDAVTKHILQTVAAFRS